MIDFMYYRDSISQYIVINKFIILYYITKSPNITSLIIKFRLFLLGRGDRIRTCGLYVPNVALHQAELHLVVKSSPTVTVGLVYWLRN